MDFRIKNLLTLVVVILIGSSAEAKTLGEVLFGTDRKNNYIGQYADNNRDRTGTGMQQLKNGEIYIGDFLNGKHSGYGMLIAADGKGIKGLPDAMFYVGNWIDNKREGMGACYTSNGDLIYRGNFSNNKPVDPYPSLSADETVYFSDMQLPSGEYFIGELRNGIPDGFGLYVLADGTRSIGRVKGGHRYGLSLLIAGTDYWMLVKWDKNSNGYTALTDASEFDARRAEHAAVQARINAELKESFMELLDEGFQLANNFMEMKQQYSGGSATYNDADYEGTAGSSGGSSSKKGSKVSGKGNDCGTAWMTDKRAYSDYESQLVPNGARTATDPADRNRIKSKMRQIRQKWEKRGCQFTKSPYED